jgi:hypothetical protein
MSIAPSTQGGKKKKKYGIFLFFLSFSMAPQG